MPQAQHEVGLAEMCDAVRISAHRLGLSIGRDGKRLPHVGNASPGARESDAAQLSYRHLPQELERQGIGAPAGTQIAPDLR
jgi:hypothetical protein